MGEDRMAVIDRDNTLAIELETGRVLIELFDDLAPLHAERLTTLAREGAYDNVAFHRVIEGFVAQAGDVEFGDVAEGYDPGLVGTGGSGLPNVPAEFSDTAFVRGIVGMARAGDPLTRFGFPERQEFLDSANSQFFIVFDDARFLDGDYTAVGQVVVGMELVDQIKRGAGSSGLVADDPDVMLDVAVYGDLFGLGLTEEEAREVALLYEAGLNRDGEIDLPGLNFWIDVREEGLAMSQIAAEFLGSGEFEAAFGDVDALSDRELVELLYQNVLGREGEADGVEFWEAAVADPGFSRADLLFAFATSVENAETSAFLDTLAEVEPGEWMFG